MPRVGVVGSLVWDVIHGRDPLSAPVEEWGGIAYALAGLDASLEDDWEIVPLIKVGRDLAAPAGEFLRSLRHLTPGGRAVEVDVPNNRVVLRYARDERRCERMSGGVPSWNWTELGPMVRDLDAVYVNFISGFEMCLGTAEALRRGFDGPIYADLHSLFLGMQHDGMRVRRPLPDAPSWFGCFDMVQLNEDEMRELSPDPLALSADAIAAGVELLVVTLGPRGAAYVAAPGSGGTMRSARVEADAVDAVDPTGCGDVFGASAFSRLLAGDDVEAALRHANRMAGRNATFRGATGLADHLRGELVRP
ncbi:MAG TPA: carbohydrate kinase family protein [Gemmatimonadales bacterium]